MVRYILSDDVFRKLKLRLKLICCAIFFMNQNNHIGEHGYDNTEPSMQPIFTARGPSFKKGVTVTTKFSNTDLYHLFCRLLGINTIKVDGTDRTDVWSQMLY